MTNQQHKVTAQSEPWFKKKLRGLIGVNYVTLGNNKRTCKNHRTRITLLLLNLFWVDNWIFLYFPENSALSAVPFPDHVPAEVSRAPACAGGVGRAVAPTALHTHRHLPSHSGPHSHTDSKKKSESAPQSMVWHIWGEVRSDLKKKMGPLKPGLYSLLGAKHTSTPLWSSHGIKRRLHHDDCLTEPKISDRWQHLSKQV